MNNERTTRPAATDGPATEPGILAELAWDDAFERDLAAAGVGLEAGRVVAVDRELCLAVTAAGERLASLAGSLRRDAEADPAAALPAVGDWLALEPSPDGRRTRIRAILPRRTAVIRRAPGDRPAAGQVLAANVDELFVVTSFNEEFNARRLERYLAVAADSKATPVVILSKVDLADDRTEVRRAVADLAHGIEVLEVSTVTGEGMDLVRRHLRPGRTIVAVGSSGVGKSSLLNTLAGRIIVSTGEIRGDDARGRHTTTRRELHRVGDGMIIDTPGLRELGVMDSAGVDSAFDEIDRLADACRFGDCRHEAEPGCAVQAAIEDGTLAPDRLRAYRKLRREARRAEIAGDALARRAEQRRWASLIREGRRQSRQKRGEHR